jgi:predicted RNase H-like nuclease (RuvC/YqgF family)
MNAYAEAAEYLRAVLGPQVQSYTAMLERLEAAGDVDSRITHGEATVVALEASMAAKRAEAESVVKDTQATIAQAYAEAERVQKAIGDQVVVLTNERDVLAGEVAELKAEKTALSSEIALLKARFA